MNIRTVIVQEPWVIAIRVSVVTQPSWFLEGDQSGYICADGVGFEPLYIDISLLNEIRFHLIGTSCCRMCLRVHITLRCMHAGPRFLATCAQLQHQEGAGHEGDPGGPLRHGQHPRHLAAQWREGQAYRREGPRLAALAKLLSA